MNQPIQNAEFFLRLTQETIYLMGISFILGSLFTIFVLLILDMMRASRSEQMAMMAEPHEYDDDAE